MVRFGGARARVGALVVIGLATGACKSEGGGDDDGAASEESGSGSDEGASSDESGEACVADCKPGGTVLFETTIGTPMGDDGTVAVAVDADGRMAMVGYSVVDPFEGTTQGFLVLYEADGTFAFQQTYTDHARGVAFATDGSVVVGGDTIGGNPWLRAYDGTGAMAWEAIDTTHAEVQGGELVRDPDGGFVMGGGDLTDGLIMRFGPTGEVVSFVQTPVNIYVSDLVVVDGGVVAVGMDPSLGVGWGGRVDDSGEVAWTATIGGGNWAAVSLAGDGNVAIVANSPVNTSRLQIYDPDGTLLISGDLPRPMAVAYDLVVLPDGNIVVVGASGDFLDRAYIARMDAIDSFAWEHDLAVEPGSSQYYDIALAPDGTLVATGSRAVAVSGNVDAWIQRLAPG